MIISFEPARVPVLAALFAEDATGLILLFGIGLIILIYIGYRLRVREIRAHNRELEKKIDEHTWALGQQKRALEMHAEQLERQRQELQALYQADEELHHHLHLDDVLQALVNLAVERLRADKSAVLTWDKAQECLIMRVARGYSPAAMTGLRFARGEMYAGRVLETGEALIVEDTMLDPHAAERRAEIAHMVQAEEVRSLMHLPIKIGNAVFGVFNVSYVRPHAFGENEQRLFTALAQRAALAIEAAQHFDAEQRRAEQFRAISEVSHNITAILETDRLLEQIVRDIQNAFGYPVVAIGLVEGDDLVVRAGISTRAPMGVALPRRFKIGVEGVMGWVASTGEPALVPDVRQDGRFVAWTPDTPSRSELAVPLKTQAGVIGVLNVESVQPHAFDQSDLLVLQSLANQAAVAIENAQRFCTEQRRAEQLQIINEIGRRISALLDKEQILTQVVRLLQQKFGYYHVGIGLIEGDEVVYRVGAGILWDDPTFEFKPQRLKVGSEGISGWVAAHGEPVIVPDVSQDSRYVWMHQSATRSEIVVPLIVHDQVIGVLDVQSDRLNAFDATDLSVLESIAHQASAAIENARLYARAQELAVMQERTRLARDLHDAVTQTLFSANLLADALPTAWEKNPVEGRQLADELRQLTRGALAEMRTLLLELRPAALIETKLGDLMRQLVDAVAGRAGLAIQINLVGDCILPAEVHIAFYRIAQEALNNIFKHARATHVALTLVCTGDRARLELRDNGRGFDLTHVAAGRFGLASMRERAQAIGATFELASQPGEGTQLVVSWKNQEVCA